MHDVTKELQLHNSLNERLNFIENLLEETVDRIIVLDKNLTYSYWNKKAEQYYHINKEYVIGKNLFEVFPSFVNDPLYLEFKKVLKGETVHIGTTINSEHQEKFSETYLVPLAGNNKEVNDILWIVHDLSKEVALRIAENELDQKEKHLEKVNDELVKQNKIFEYAEQIANMGTWIWNPETDKSHYSDNMYRLFGMEPQEVEPNFETIPKFIHPEDKQIVLNSAKDLKEGNPTVIEYRVIRKDGALRNFRNRTQIMDYNSEKYVIGTTQDITEMYEKDMAQQNSEMLLRKKDEFLSIASHELKSPVSNIKASIQILQDLAEDLSEKETFTPFLERSAKQANKLSELINDLLDASIIEGGNIKLKRSLFNVREAIQEIADEYCNERKDCEIKTEGDKEIEVLADRLRLQQVINNFIGNAFKYSPKDKTVRIKVEKLDKEIKVSVIDKGIGISNDKLPMVFDKYFRVDESSKKFAGLGLGLYITKEIIKKHGGTVGVNSTEGKGSTFWFTIPTPPPH
jgi:two-component system CheB/CheR fusion protein